MSMIPIIALGSAGLYSVAMISMKYWWKLPGAGLGLLIIVTLLAAATLELAALREERLGIIYTGILGAEVVLIAIASFFLFGESFSQREVIGIGLVILGTALAWA
ncbi:SMR family transporter [Ruegeria atlantica]|uniref:SMR family transporter n=1 Tax=Ruegeria atlantica TaxID=81569 RepID=UPI0020C20B16|nr:SMR family transporter [Ruegeria atlantica]